MAYSRDYNARINWENFPSTNTAVDADNLNKMDYAIFEHDKKIVELDGRVETVKESVTEDVAQAKEYSDLSKDYALESKNFSEQSLDYANQSKSYIDDSKAEADRAYSEAERARMYADTVQEGITTTTSRELADSEPGGIRIISMDGESQQNGTPTPEVEVPIDSVEISEIWTHGNQLFNMRNAKYKTISYDATTNKYIDQSSIGVRTYYEKVLPNTTYTISKTVGNIFRVTTCSQEPAIGVEVTNTNNDTSQKTVTITTGEFDNYIAFYPINTNDINQGITYDTVISSIMLNIGSTALPYEPYTETKETLSAPIVLRGIGDVKDVLCKQNDVFGVLRKIKEVDLSAITSWSKDSSFANKNAFYKYNYLSDAVSVPGYYTVANLSCNRLITYGSASVTSQEINGIAQGGGKTLYVSVIGKTTSADLVSYFAENETYIHYVLETPTFEPLPLADQIALHKLETFGGVTYLFTDSTIEPIIDVEYGTSKVGGYAIKALNNSEISLLKQEQLEQLTNELATQIVAGSEA